MSIRRTPHHRILPVTERDRAPAPSHATDGRALRVPRAWNRSSAGGDRSGRTSGAPYRQRRPHRGLPPMADRSARTPVCCQRQLTFRTPGIATYSRRGLAPRAAVFEGRRFGARGPPHGAQSVRATGKSAAPTGIAPLAVAAGRTPVRLVWPGARGERGYLHST